MMDVTPFDDDREPFDGGSPPMGSGFALASVRLRVTIGFIAWGAVRAHHEAGFSHLKLQKLLYYMQGFCAARTGSALFPEEIEAWKLGPVVRDVWYECNEFGAADLPVQDFKNLYSPAILDDFELAIMRWVYSARGHLSGPDLVLKTHTEKPWTAAWRNGRGQGSIISVHSMSRFFYRVNS